MGTRSLEGGSHKKRGENSGREKEKRGPNFDRETERVRSPSSWLSLSPLRGTLESFDSGQASFPRGAKGLLFSRLILGPIMAQKLLARFSSSARFFGALAPFFPARERLLLLCICWALVTESHTSPFIAWLDVWAECVFRATARK